MATVTTRFAPRGGSTAKGYDVELFEYRADMRKETISAGKSINLALSARGLHALDVCFARLFGLVLCCVSHTLLACCANSASA